MKYIRTKNAVMDIKEAKYRFRYCDGSYEEIIKESDNIEELLDNVVVFDTHGDSHYVLKRFLGSFEFKEWMEDGERQNNRYVFYGAIWTDKGLIYVAKMKGILPNGNIDWELL